MHGYLHHEGINPDIVLFCVWLIKNSLNHTKMSF